MQPQSKLVRWNGRLVRYSASWSSLNKELGLRVSGSAWTLDKATLAWSLIIFLTSLYKFFNFHPNHLAMERVDESSISSASVSIWARHHQTHHGSLRSLLSLDYLPQLDSFGKLYYGLMSVCIGAPLVWRLYLVLARPLSSWAPESRPDAAAQLVRFIVRGPSNEASPGLSQHRREPRRARLGQVPELANHRPHLEGKPLAMAHQPSTYLGQHKLVSSANRKKAHLDGHLFYQIPVRAMHFPTDRSIKRWRLLFRYSFHFWLLVLCIIPSIIWFTGKALYLLLRRFGQPGPMLIYGILELAYTSSQCAMLFLFTNLFVTFFYAHLIYRARPLNGTLKRLAHRLERQEGPGMKGRAAAQRHQLSLWSYFDQLSQLDRFVSKFSMISVVAFVIGISFGQSYLQVADHALQLGAASVMAANFISFAFLYFLSWHIELQSIRMYKRLLSIIAREDDFVTKRAWQRVLFGFYQHDKARTFTMAGQYPLNLHYYFKTVFSILTMSLVMNRLFQKRVWNNLMPSMEGGGVE